MKARVIIWSVILTAAMLGCGKKWKQPVAVNLRFEVKPAETGTPGTAGTLSIKSGSILTTSLDFSGKRKKGGDVSFQHTCNASVDIATGIPSPSVSFDIPQGTYTAMDCKLLISSNPSGSNTIVLTGTYTQMSQQVVPVIIEINASYPFSIHVKENSGGDEIVLVKDDPRQLCIKVDIREWLATVTSAMLESATQVNIGGENSIYINSVTNSSLYNDISTRISSGVGVSARFD